MKDEDIFEKKELTKLIVRWSDKQIKSFEDHNDLTFEVMNEQLSAHLRKCIFLNTEDEEHLAIIRIEDAQFLWLFMVWEPLTFTYAVRVSGARKTRIENQSFPEDLLNDKKIEDCDINFINSNDAVRAPYELENLYEEILKLKTISLPRISDNHEVWSKWIRAQHLIVKQKALPFKVSGICKLEEVRNKGGRLTGHQFSIDIERPDQSDYRLIEEEMSNELGISEKFDSKGNIYLKSGDIWMGLDQVIRKKFKNTIKRKAGITAILKFRLLPIVDQLKTYFSDPEYVFQASSVSYNDRNQDRLLVSPGNLDLESLKKFLGDRGYQHRSFVGEFFVHHNNDIGPKNNHFNNVKGLAFSDNQDYGTILPEPEKNKFVLEKTEEVMLDVFGRYLLQLYGKGNLKMRKSLVFIKNNNAEHDSQLYRAIYDDIARELYGWDFDVTLNRDKSTISYDFETADDCKTKFDKLKSLNKLAFDHTPDQPDFKYKVKTVLIRQKQELIELEERIADLSGTEFEIPGNEKERSDGRGILCGKLSGKDSSVSRLVFRLNNKSQEEKKILSLLRKRLESKKAIRKVSASLTGELKKIEWLREALRKISKPSRKLNGKPVNPKLGKFLFDSSTASEIYKDLGRSGEAWAALKDNELLKLNDGQRTAVLTALHAEDLALIQGPPGTGKTTVIAELMWQLISREPKEKILLVSETNLAVDNALEKLAGNGNALVKPIRLGRIDKLEEEGRKFSPERIDRWTDETKSLTKEETALLAEEEDRNVDNNCVRSWMIRIAERASHSTNPKYKHLIKRWVQALSHPDKDTKALFRDQYYQHVNVIGSTCSSCGSPSFVRSFQSLYNSNNRFRQDPANRNYWKPVIFDTVIMDEASKATPPEILLPLCFGKKSVLIGDHKQLPPMLSEKDFREALLELKDDQAKQLADEIDREFVSTSQFERLIMNKRVSPTIIGRLNIQYRMHPKINRVISQFYEDDSDIGLSSADELLKNADDPNMKEDFSRYHGLTQEGFINPDIHTIWVNVDAPEEKSGTSRINEQEVQAVKSVLQYLKNSEGFKSYFEHWQGENDAVKRRQEQEIGIISFYGHQVARLKDVSRYAEKNLRLPVRLRTVDKFQGMERNIVIVSTVRSNRQRVEGTIRKNKDIGFAKAPERLNVALSRARRLLIVVGNLDFFESWKTADGKAIYKNAIKEIRREGMIIDDHKKLNLYR